MIKVFIALHILILTMTFNQKIEYVFDKEEQFHKIYATPNNSYYTFELYDLGNNYEICVYNQSELIEVFSDLVIANDEDLSRYYVNSKENTSILITEDYELIVSKNWNNAQQLYEKMDVYQNLK
jgi:hypothetical protein